MLEPKLTGPVFKSEEEKQAYLAEIDAYWKKMHGDKPCMAKLKPMSEVTEEEREAAYQEFLKSEFDEPDSQTGRSTWGPVR